MKDKILIKERNEKVIEAEQKIKAAVKELYDFLYKSVDTCEELETEIKRSASDMRWRGSRIEEEFLLESMKDILEKEKGDLPLDYKKERGRIELKISADTSEVDDAIEKTKQLKEIMEEAERTRKAMNASYINGNLLPIISIVISLLAIIRTI